MSAAKGKASTGATAEASSEVTQNTNQGFNMPHSTEVTSSAIVTPDLSVVGGQITTTSRQIAEHFGKRHDTVLRAIRNLECSAEFHARNFAEMVVAVEIGNGAIRRDPAYRMTRDGFSFLAMGFTGKDAALWKEAYIAAFNRMESELLAKPLRSHDTADKYERINPLNAPELNAARKVAEEYFDNFRAAVKAGKPNPAMGEIPHAVLQGMVSRAVVSQRTLSWFDWQTGRMCCKLVESDASVFSLTSGDYDDLMERVPMERVPEMLEAINRRVASHIGAFSDHLKRSRKPAAICA